MKQDTSLGQFQLGCFSKSSAPKFLTAPNILYQEGLFPSRQSETGHLPWSVSSPLAYLGKALQSLSRWRGR